MAAAVIYTLVLLAYYIGPVAGSRGSGSTPGDPARLTHYGRPMICTDTHIESSSRGGIHAGKSIRGLIFLFLFLLLLLLLFL